jgi:hypothetical protein
MAEDKKRKKGQKEHGQKMVGQKITDDVNGLKIDQNTGGENKHPRPKGEP